MNSVHVAFDEKYFPGLDSSDPSLSKEGNNNGSASKESRKTQIWKTVNTLNKIETSNYHIARIIFSNHFIFNSSKTTLQNNKEILNFQIIQHSQSKPLHQMHAYYMSQGGTQGRQKARFTLFEIQLNIRRS